MSKLFAINGSPQTEKGHTALLLSAFLKGTEEAGATVELVYPDRLDIKPCACSQMYCWNKKPGECCIVDEMQVLYPKLKASNILVLATPVYIPLPGAIQNMINRLVPLFEPELVFRSGRTRARLRPDVAIKSVALVVTSGWWEKENCDTVVRIVREFAEDASLPFAGALVRPHSSYMKRAGKLTTEGEAVLDAARQAGRELIQKHAISPALLEKISHPLISREDYWKD